MKILYFSFTGNCRRFAEKLGEAQPMKEHTGSYEPLVLVFPTIGFGNVPNPVMSFVKKHHHQLLLVVSSGNRNWGPNFANGAKIITQEFGIPSDTIELAGTPDDVERIREKLNQLCYNGGGTDTKNKKQKGIFG